MLLIYVPKMTNRLGYTINVIFRDILGVPYAITHQKDLFLSHTEERLCYGPLKVGDNQVPYLRSCHLLFDTVIEDQDYGYFEFEGKPALFPVYGADCALPFDIFAAVFYMISRYEEYLPHAVDEHGRFLSEDSVASRHGFLQMAVVDRWALRIRSLIQAYYPTFSFPHRQVHFLHTIDIDSAYSFRHKPLFRTVMGALRDFELHNLTEVRHRFRVLRNKEEDPFDTFDYIIDVNQRHQGDLLFFALLGDFGIYDKPIPYQNNEFRQLLQHLGDYAKVGIHGSYYSAEEPERLQRETVRLREILHRPIVRNRFHFLRFPLPLAYEHLVRCGIQHDYSMGYADRPGFRCGTGSEIPFFNLSSDQESPLHIHPFVVMDTTLHTHQQLSVDESKQQLKQLVDEVKAVGGTFTDIFHNQNLCEQYGWEGWRGVYEGMMNYIDN